MDEDGPLADLLPVPLEELVYREALGAPGSPSVEVGLRGDRFAASRGRPRDRGHFVWLRALGAVRYPASRVELVEQAAAFLPPELAGRLQALPEQQYGGELEVLEQLQALDQRAEPSAGDGNQSGSLANR